MEHKHLTDEEIQDLLDKHDSKQDIERKHHLKNCQICQESLKQYRTLYVELERAPGFTLPKNFEKSVVSKVIHKQAAPFLSSTMEITLIITGILMALGTTFYLVRVKAFTETIGRIVLPKLAIDTSFIQPIKDLLSGLNGNLVLIPFAVLTLVVVAVLDRIIQKLKHHKLSL